MTLTHIEALDEDTLTKITAPLMEALGAQHPELFGIYYQALNAQVDNGGKLLPLVCRVLATASVKAWVDQLKAER